MSRISSETIFNFTDNIDYLVDNLKYGIYCHCTTEELPLRNNMYRVPMACFCDIPLSLIKEHFDWYGRYGIGIKRSYARENGVKPVWYVTSENNLVKNIIRQTSLRDYELKHLVPYMKKFMGDQFYEKENRKKRKKFYDEREWRYIPAGAGVETFFGKKACDNMCDAPQEGARMPLEVSAIEYIIIESDSDFGRMIDELKKIAKPGDGVSFETLLSKIITATQIERDF